MYFGIGLPILRPNVSGLTFVVSVAIYPPSQQNPVVAEINRLAVGNSAVAATKRVLRLLALGTCS